MDHNYNPPYPRPQPRPEDYTLQPTLEAREEKEPPKPEDRPIDPAVQLSEAITNSQEVLFTAKTVFPFTLFPDTITLDREKLTIAHRFFIRVAEELSIRIEDILNITADVGPIFGSIKLQTRFFDPSKPYTISYLKRNDALRVKRIVQGHIIATQKKIDCSVFSGKQLAELLDDLGQGSLEQNM